MDPLRDRVDALTQQLHTLQQQTHALQQHTHTVNRRLRWWRGLACGLVGLAVLAWMLPAVIAQEDAADKGQRGLAQRVAALEQLLKHVSREGHDLFITGANLHLVNGLGQTACGSEEESIPDCPNGLGNLIVGYNESRVGSGFCEFDPSDPVCIDIRTGSHNVVIGREHNFSRFGGLVVGLFNTISGDFAVVSGGQENTASGSRSVVSGGAGNTASNDLAAVSSGGQRNTASGISATVSGGQSNTASGFAATVSGGAGNTASDSFAVVSGGSNNTASGVLSVVSGGLENTASGVFATVSGGQNRTAAGEFDWVAGSLVEED
jgi:hypothetical protein